MTTRRIALALSLALLAPLPLAAQAGATQATSTPATQATVVDVAVGSPDHTTLVAAVKAADLAGTLSSAGPFTVFAPTNGAFDALPAGTVDTLLKPESKAALTGVLTYHVVSGRVDAATLVSSIEAGGGKAELTTVQGEKLVASLDGDRVVVIDAQGGKAQVTAADLGAGNGVVHVVDRVLMP
jgi:uncharacterized surface protein with fasciclin (FAS1) repeats